MRILAVHDQGGIQMRGAVDDDALVAVFMCGQDTQLNGQRQDVPHLLLLGPGTELSAIQPGEYRYLRVGLRGPALRALAERPPSAQSVQPWLRRGVFTPRCSAAAEWRLQRSLLRALRFAGPATLRGGGRDRPSPPRRTTSWMTSWRRWYARWQRHERIPPRAVATSAGGARARGVACDPR